MFTLRSVVWMFSIGVMVSGPGMVLSQDFPDKPIRFVTVAAGSGVDFAARLIAQEITGPLGQPVVVDNRAGYLSAELVSKASPDGYTLLIGPSPLFFAPLMLPLAYDPVKDFVPITLLVRAPTMLVISPNLSVNSVKELIALAKAKPAALNYVSAQTGGSGHLTAELFKAMAGVDIVRVSYKGSAMAFPDLMTGQVHMMFENPASVMPLIKAGKLKGLAVTSLQPTPLIPGLPTVAATVPGFESVTVSGMFAPVKTPEAIVKRLSQETVRVLSRPDVKEKFAGTGAEAVGSSPEELAAWLKAAISRMGKVIKDAGIKPD